MKKEIKLDTNLKRTPKSVAQAYIVENIGINIRVSEPIKDGDKYKLLVYLPLDNGERVVCGVITLNKDYRIEDAPSTDEIDDILTNALIHRFTNALLKITREYSDIYVGMKSGIFVRIMFKRVSETLFEKIMKVAKTYLHKVAEIGIVEGMVYIDFMIIE